MRTKILLLLSSSLALSLFADEGMWLYNAIPKQQIEKKYRIKLTDPLLEHLRLSSVKFGGGSGSFVSPNGLIFTNHHVALDCIQKVGDPQHNYVRDGFAAKSYEEEKTCPALEIGVLLHITDVTPKVKEAAAAGRSDAENNKAQKAVISEIEKGCKDKTGNRCEVVTLYAGGAYHLYEYKRYTDVRLVFAPEQSIAFFGGDPDNFTYPRYDLDITFLRAYENGKPAKIEHYLKWSREGAKGGELALVSGHPGTTARLQTVAQLEFQRDEAFPKTLATLKTTIDALHRFSAGSQENARIAREDLFGAENSYKAITGFEQGLKDPALMAIKAKEEKDLRAKVDADPKMKGEYGNAWTEIADAYKSYSGYAEKMSVATPSSRSRLFGIALGLVRYVAEVKKPDGDRLPGYTTAALPMLERRLYSPAPIYDSLEKLLLALSFEEMLKTLGPDDVLMKQALAGRSPSDAAAWYVANTKLKDVAERKRLAADEAAVSASDDAMIRLAKIFDQRGRDYQKRYDDEVEAVVRKNSTKLAQARFAIMGANQYPDATGTLRLTWGPITGYKNDSGNPVPPFTDFAGAFQHATGVDPFKLPDSWIRAKSRLKPDVPLNFVSTCDIHGGNSGSPTVNAKGELIGIIFDMNIEALPNRFVYMDRQGRAVHVASQGIIEALLNVYHAGGVLAELGFGKTTD